MRRVDPRAGAKKYKARTHCKAYKSKISSFYTFCSITEPLQTQKGLRSLFVFHRKKTQKKRARVLVLFLSLVSRLARPHTQNRRPTTAARVPIVSSSLFSSPQPLFSPFRFGPFARQRERGQEGPKRAAKGSAMLDAQEQSERKQRANVCCSCSTNWHLSSQRRRCRAEQARCFSKYGGELFRPTSLALD